MRAAEREPEASEGERGALHRVKHLWRMPLDLLYPPLCPLCNLPSDRPGRLLCWSCCSTLPLHTLDEAICHKCGHVPEGEVDHDFLCSTCRHHPPRFECARTAASFSGGLRRMLHDFKYNGATWLCHDLVDLLEGAARVYYQADEIDLVVPVPLHITRERQRSYNQAALLARGLAQRLKLACRPRALRRRWGTPKQSLLGARGRRHNLRGAFEAAEPDWLRGRTVLVIDDIMTTGSTLDEVAKSLLQAGAWRVWALAIARG